MFLPSPFMLAIVSSRLSEMMSYKMSSRLAQCFPAFLSQFEEFVISCVEGGGARLPFCILRMPLRTQTLP